MPLPRKHGAGAFRDKVTIYKDSGNTFDSRGQTISDTTLVLRTYADIRPIRGDETEYARQLTGTETHSITVRYTTFFGNLTHKHWLTFDDRTFSVIGIYDRDNRRRLLDLICGEKV
jgi:SPP1 family predicted phage head-tail adaptor